MIASIQVRPPQAGIVHTIETSISFGVTFASVPSVSFVDTTGLTTGFDAIYSVMSITTTGFYIPGSVQIGTAPPGQGGTRQAYWTATGYLPA